MTMLGTAANPNMTRHPLLEYRSSAPSTMPAKNCPKVIIRVLIVTNVPLMLGEAASAIYTGVVKDAMPIPNPTTILPTTRIS